MNAHAFAALQALRTARGQLEAAGLPSEAAEATGILTRVDVLGALLEPASSATGAERDAAREEMFRKLRGGGYAFQRYTDPGGNGFAAVEMWRVTEPDGTVHRFKAW